MVVSVCIGNSVDDLMLEALARVGWLYMIHSMYPCISHHTPQTLQPAEFNTAPGKMWRVFPSFPKQLSANSILYCGEDVCNRIVSCQGQKWTVPQ